eukprot:8580089-Pyramimonas_sp.AAC.1
MVAYHHHLHYHHHHRASTVPLVLYRVEHREAPAADAGIRREPGGHADDMVLARPILSDDGSAQRPFRGRCRHPNFGVSIAHGDPSGQIRNSTLPRATRSSAGLRTPSADAQPT